MERVAEGLYSKSVSATECFILLEMSICMIINHLVVSFVFSVVEYRLSRSEDAFQELNRKSSALKRILSRIPDEIIDRKTFLETIKYVLFSVIFTRFVFEVTLFITHFALFREIASAIKKLLDAVNEVAGFIPGTTGKQALEQRKREFVKFSKRFSNTLKEYFKEGQ